jgi:tRNA-dihydrouridine synthase B
MNTLQTIDLQLTAIDEFFGHLQSRDHRLQYDSPEDNETQKLALEAI